MTSEADSKQGRRPPTIELKATEVGKTDAAPESGATASADAPAQDPSGPRASGRWFHGVAAGGVPSHVASAVIGAIVIAAIGSGLWFAGYLPARRIAPSTGAAASDSTAMQALAARLNDIQSQLRSRSPVATQPDPVVGKRIAAIETQTKALAGSLAALGNRLDDIAATSQSAAKTASTAQAAAAAAESQIQTVSHAASQAGAQRSDLDALSSRIATLEGTVKALSAKVDRPAPSTDDRAARLTIAAESLRAAVESGRAYQAELTAVQSLGAAPNVTAPLQRFAATGVPSAAALARQLDALTPSLQRAANPSDASTLLGRLEQHAQRLVRITPVNAPAGNTPADIVGRIEVDAGHADIAAALADIAALPDSTKPVVADWAAQAKAREAAMAASRQIAAAAVAGLAKPVSQ